MTHINFLRLRDLIGDDNIDEPLSEEDYLRAAAGFRARMAERYLPENFDAVAHVTKDADTTFTYRGYIKFLETDLATRVDESGPQTKAQIKKHNEGVAIKMIARGKVSSHHLLAMKLY